ncbi:LPS-assembly protein LptD [Candidatus Sumerlaeota bacterium]|nr:LPS-assembly protein LptD [Candidatus Sumerlaeota bacterium]
MFLQTSAPSSPMRPFGRTVLLLICSLLLLRADMTRAEVQATLDPSEARRLAPAAKIPRQRASESDVLYDPKEAERFRVLRKTMTSEELSKTEFRLRALEGFVDYDEVQDVFYGPGRTQVYYGRYFLEADKLIFDNRLQEVQAEGNVILRTIDDTPKTPVKAISPGSGRGAGKGEAKETKVQQDEIHADSLRYNFAEGEGVGFNVHGVYSPIYFKTEKTSDTKTADRPQIPQFQQVSPQESLFRNTQISACDFKIPHYRVRAREVILFQKDRIFFRGATFYIMDTPVLYLPFYTRGLTGGSPWFVQLGVGSRTGPRIRIGYEYEHRSDEPSLEDDTKYETRSAGQAQTFVDYLSQRGFGGGFDYKYQFDFGRHEGEFQAYGIEDFKRETVGNTVDSNSQNNQAERSQIYWQHRTQITPNLYAIIDVDWFSDPEIFYDILDYFNDDEYNRWRQMERHTRVAVTYVREAYVARLVYELKDRIGINRFGDLSDPSDNNNDFDIEPGTKLKNANANSIDGSRWGRVTERAPQFTFATRYLPVRNWPLYLMSELNIYHNLDKGINVVSSRDDAMVNGLDFYNQGLWRYKISEAYVLLVKVGAGVGAAQRQDDDLGISMSDLGPDDALVLVDDKGTFLVGKDRFNLKDIKDFYAWGDTEIRLNARFTDAITGFLAWRFRETTQDFIGDFYAKVGDVNSRQDLFNYRLRQNFVQGNLTYRLLYPIFYAFANAGYNLESKSNLFPNETIAFANSGFGWTNRRGTMNLTTTLGVNRRQIFAPSDPRSEQADFLYGRVTYEYNPIHGRWYARIDLDHSQSLGGNNGTDKNNSAQFTFFSDQRTRESVTVIYGRELGPKWNTEVRLRLDQQVGGLRDASWILQRDLHDAIAILRLRTRQDFTRASNANDNTQQFDLTFGLKLKLPGQEVAFGARDARTVKQRERQPVSAY